MIAYLLTAILVLVSYLLIKVSTSKNYWKTQNVPYSKAWPILGNFGDYVLLRRYIGHVVQKICQQFPDEPYFGVYYGTEPALVVQDPGMIKQMLTKDFYYFSSREVSDYTHKEVLTQSMFFTYGDRWKLLRQNFSPLFSSAKMRNMFHLIQKSCNAFEGLLAEETKNKSVEIKSLLARYTMDCIGSCTFGIDTNTMGREVENNAFKKLGDMIFEISNVRGFSLISRSMWPAFFYGLGYKVFPTKMNEFFHELLIGVFKARNYEPSQRNDFVDLLLCLTKRGYIEGDSLDSHKTENGRKTKLEVNDELLVSQCISFFAAGYETSATTLSFTLYELAKNEHAQSHAAKEVQEYLSRNEGRVNYDSISELVYLEACVNEALRLYPVLGMLTRETAHEATVGGVRLSRGTRVLIPVYHLHYREDIFPEPAVFRPERFLPPNRHNIQQYAYLPFGEGPRICIGMRFAKMMMLAGLVTLLSRYRVELAPGMPREITLEPRAIITQPAQGIYLKLVERSHE